MCVLDDYSHNTFEGRWVDCRTACRSSDEGGDNDGDEGLVLQQVIEPAAVVQEAAAVQAVVGPGGLHEQSPSSEASGYGGWCGRLGS